MDAVELKVTREGKDSLELIFEWINLETKEEKQRVNNLEQKHKEVFTRIPDSTHVAMRNVEG
jgi:hypothetical protein